MCVIVTTIVFKCFRVFFDFPTLIYFVQSTLKLAGFIRWVMSPSRIFTGLVGGWDATLC